MTVEESLNHKPYLNYSTFVNDCDHWNGYIAVYKQIKSFCSVVYYNMMLVDFSMQKQQSSYIFWQQSTVHIFVSPAFRVC